MTAEQIAVDTAYTLTPAGLAALDAYAPDTENGDMAQDAPEDAETPSVVPTHELSQCNGDAEPQDDTFTPDDADKVDWVLGKIADARSRALRVRENAERIARQHEAEAEGLEWRFGAALQAFARQQTDGTRRRSVRLLNGVLGYRTRPASVSVTDEAAALAWAKVNRPFAVAERLDKRALAACLLESGEVADGTQFSPAEEVFYIK